MKHIDVFKPSFRIIAAYVVNNKCIGKNNQLPFHLPQDMKCFKEITMGKPIIMGRKTYESLDGPLLGRENIIISRSMSNPPDGFRVFNELEAGLAYAHKWKAKKMWASDNNGNLNEFERLWEQVDPPSAPQLEIMIHFAEIMIIGGAEIYAQTINRCNRMHITEVHAKVEGCDAFFPKYDIDEWNIIKEKSYDDGDIPCIYKQLERKSWSQPQAHR